MMISRVHNLGNYKFVGVLATALLIRLVISYSIIHNYVSLTTYDITLYIGFGKKFMEALITGSLESAASVNIGTPPLGMILTGISIQVLGRLTGEVEASMIPSIISSSLTVIPIYLIAKRYSEKAGLIASVIYALDPYVVQFSLTYLDPLATLFTLIAVLLVLHRPSRNSYLLSGILLGLASLTKLTFIIYAIIIALMLSCYRYGKKSLLIMGISLLMLLFIPWIWFPEARAKAVEHHLSFNSYLPVVLVGPELIRVPQAHAWYILSYFGLGQVFWNTLPFISPLILLFMIVYRFFKGELYLPLMPSIATSAMILTIFLLPRNYWTYSWAGGAVQGILSRQFYPYYFYPTGPFIAVLAGILLSGRHDNSVKSRFLSYPIFMAALVSPMAVIMNLGLPYWDFIFTIIYNLTAGQFILEGIIATLITTAMLVVLLLVSEKLHRSLNTDLWSSAGNKLQDSSRVT
ncbi:MAG: glycosyltransferase family 39 protein [Nitrososphaerota archaeon]